MCLIGHLLPSTTVNLDFWLILPPVLCNIKFTTMSMECVLVQRALAFVLFDMALPAKYGLHEWPLPTPRY